MLYSSTQLTKELSIVSVAFLTLILIVSITPFSPAANSIEEVKQRFREPPADCHPHTRWWWPGNPVTQDEITWQLREMHEKGIRGVEQITMGAVYEKGNIPFLSEEFFEMLQHTAETAEDLGMYVSINFGGPGWVIGCPGVPPEDKSKSLVPTFVDVEGPGVFDGPLPVELREARGSWELPVPRVTERDRLTAVVAGRLVDDAIDPDSMIVLTDKVESRSLHWRVPEGRWRLMTFWTVFTGQGDAVDHFSKAAMERYCDYFGGMLYDHLGEYFGTTVESLFCDSFEVAFAPNGIYWSYGLLKRFEREENYDLTPYLPAIWWDIGELTPKIRYDVNRFLHKIGMEAFFEPFLDWCEKHNVKGRIQPYGFPTDVLEGAGETHIPEMEITAGEKDAVPWFDTRIGPKKYVASGAHLYGRNVVSTEAYTFLHWEPYRATLEELKIATDNFLRSGANKIYNHGYIFCPERDIAPARTSPSAIRISHENIWWKYYPLLADYIARCCYMLRQGDFVADVAIYSPLANQWTKSALDARRWTRSFEWGELGELLIANGYDFDLVNDDILQNSTEIRDGKIKIRNNAYSFLIVPNIQAMPLKTLQFIEEYARKGGVVIALERIPSESVGLLGHEQRDEEVRKMAGEMFAASQGRDNTGRKRYGEGWTYQITQVMDRTNVLDRRSSVLDPFVNALRNHLPPDVGIDFVREGIRRNEGLAFIHRVVDRADVYFVTNIQDRPVDTHLTFRTSKKLPWTYNPYTGEISRVYVYREVEHGIEIPVTLASYESSILVFQPGEEILSISDTDFSRIIEIEDNEAVALTDRNGPHSVCVHSMSGDTQKRVVVDGIPALYAISGDWTVTFEGRRFDSLTKQMTRLTSWTEIPEVKHFSGTATYELTFEVPREYCARDICTELDLGKVGDIAEVTLNGNCVGLQWMRGQRLDVTDFVRPGENRIEILVTNTLINRVSGLDKSPPVPADLVPHYGGGIPPLTQHMNVLSGFEPLPSSGLIGPIRIVAMKKVTLGLD